MQSLHKGLITLLLPLLIVLTVSAADESNVPIVLVLGNSLSASYGIPENEGWVALLQQELMRKNIRAKVVNFSQSGETTKGALEKLPMALNAHRPDVVLIELGGNDGLRGYPVQHIEQNLTQMVELAQEAGASVVIAGMQLPPSHGPRYTRNFRNIYPHVAQSTQSVLVPFFLENVATDRSLMQADGIHPNSKAQRLLLENVYEFIVRAITKKQRERGSQVSSAIQFGTRLDHSRGVWSLVTGQSLLA